VHVERISLLSVAPQRTGQMVVTGKRIRSRLKPARSFEEIARGLEETEVVLHEYAEQNGKLRP